MLKSIASETGTGICVVKTHTGSFRAAISRPGLKSQSAMEYLMTYGWAILIIAVVLGALFSLGVFNANNFAPKASPGACQVFRPNGPGTTMDINLAGECQGLEPQYVAQFNGHGSSGGGSYITTPPETTGQSSFSISFWMMYAQLPVNNVETLFSNQYLSENTHLQKWTVLLDTRAYPYGPLELRLNDGSVQNDFTPQYASTCEPDLTTLGRWHFATITVNTIAQTYAFYADGNSCGSGSYSGEFTGSNTFATTNSVYIGASAYDYNGSLANVQIYNASLSANQIQALYQEGIGGAPINPMYLVGWWPMNGNANDYSGNNNNGQATSVTYTSSWTSGYTPP